jgi:Holliday junction DNA helicase RuvB
MNMLRPDSFDGIIGQSRVIDCVKVDIKATRVHGGVFPHSLFNGPPGTGKTTIARAIAKELGTEILIGNGGSIINIKGIMPYLVRLERGHILFIDEIHRMNKMVQELLFTVMEDFYVDIGKGASTINLEPFSFIGATTDEGLLLKPFRDRFISKHSLSLYKTNELCNIIKNSAQKLSLNMTTDAIVNLARRSRGTPRVSNNYLQWIRNVAIANNIGIVNSTTLNKAMAMKGVDKYGTTKNDRTYLGWLKRVGKPVGLSTLVSMVNLSRETIEEVIEPFLIYKGWIRITSRGRMLV